MVLPVRMRGVDIHGKSFEEWAHTLDITPTGARLGAIHHEVKVGDKVVLQYKQRKIEFKVCWVRSLEGTKEYQFGIVAVDLGSDVWRLDLAEATAGDDYDPSRG